MTAVTIRLASKDGAWFTANPTKVLEEGQHVYLSDGGAEFVDAYVIGDGSTQLQDLPWKGIKPTALVESVTGSKVDNTDPNNPVILATTKADVGLGNVDNTSDANKPVSIAQASAISSVQSDIDSHELNTSNPHNTTKSQVGLSNVQNVDTTTTANISDSTNKRFVTDAEQTVIGNTSGTNTGDNATNSTSNAYADSKVLDSIADGDTTHAPSRNSVSDALALKEELTNKSTSVTTDQASNTKYPSVKSVFDWATGLFATISNLALKVNKSGDNLSGPVNANQGNNIASASTTDIGAATGEYVFVTGTTTITSLGTIQAGTSRTVVFTGSLTLTHNATSLILPGAANIQTVAGDIAVFRSEGSGNWRCVSYMLSDDSYTNYSPVFTGYSVAPTFATGDCRWKMITRNTCHLIVNMSNSGTQNATTKTITFPFVPKSNSVSSVQSWAIPVFDNSTNKVGVARAKNGSNVVDVYSGVISTAWSGSNGANFFIDIVFQADI